jgi:homoserine O-acetyltransferase
MSTLKVVSLSKFTISSGRVLIDFPLSYHHYGKALGKAPVIVVNHALTGNAELTGTKGWWPELVGDGKVIDTLHYTVLSFNVPGNGVNGHLLEDYSDFHTGDVAALFLQGLKQLGIHKLFALIGGSIGGGIAWEMAALAPQLTERLIPIASDWKASDWILANTYIQKQILEHSSDPLRDARQHAMLLYRNPESLEWRFNRSFNEEKNCPNVESWLHHHGEKLHRRFQLQAYKTMNHLLSTVNIARDGEDPITRISAIPANVHMIAIDSDLFFTPHQDQKTYALVKPHKENIYFHEISSLHGHDAFLIEHDKMKALLTSIFKKPISSKAYESSTRTHQQ